MDTKNYMFFYLLKMNDPEAQKKQDEIIQKFIRTNGHSHDPIDIISNLRTLSLMDNAYSIEKLIEISKVNILYVPMSDGTESSFDTDVLIELLILCEYNKIETKYPIYKIDILNEKELRKYSEEIIEAANKLVVKLKEKEQYWMDNMPFNKN
jgi:hypothetical protein